MQGHSDVLSLVLCVLTVMPLSKHTPGSCCLRASVSSLFYWRRKKSPALLFSGFLRDQESKEHFVQAAKPALLSEAREVRLRRKPFTDYKRGCHTQQSRGGRAGKPSLTPLCRLSQGSAYFCVKAILGVGMVQLAMCLPHKHEAWSPTSRVHVTELGVVQL